MYFPDKTSEMEAVWSVCVRARLESLIPKLAHLCIRLKGNAWSGMHSNTVVY